MNAHDREQAMDAELERLAEAHVLLGRESLKRELELQQQVQLAERGADLARQAREQDRMESTAREQALQAEVDRLKDELAAPGPIPYSVRQSYERLIAQARLDGLREGVGLALDYAVGRNLTCAVWADMRPDVIESLLASRPKEQP